MLVDDASACGKFIRMVDLSNSNAVTFDQELYDHFDYSASRPFFHVFETADTVAALSFASEKDATSFLEMIHKVVPGCSNASYMLQTGRKDLGYSFASPGSQ